MAKIHVRFGDNEIDLDGSEEFVQKHLDRFYATISSGSSATPLKQQLLSEKKPAPPDHAPSPAEFYKSKGKTDGTSQILIFAKYLEQFRDIPAFTKGQVNDVAKEAKISKDIHSQYFTNAVKQGLLRSLSSGKYSLTLSAEELLASMQA